jgi:hypothetical protein
MLRMGILIGKRGFLLSLILFAGLFTSYFIFTFYVLRFLIPSIIDLSIVQASLHFVIAITFIAGSFFIHKLNKLHLIYMSSGIFSIIAASLLLVSFEVLRLIMVFLMGILFSIGFLSFFEFFWGLSVPEERGRISGLIGSIASPFYFFVVIVAADTLNFLGTIILSVVISLGIILSGVLLRIKNAESIAKKYNRAYSPEKRTIFLYLIPWLLFSLINTTLARNTTLDIAQQVSSSFYLVLLILQLLGVIIGALVGGTIADLFGRRLPLTLSLSLYGASAVLSGLFINNEMLAFSYIINGLSWGVLFTLYIFVIWGDLANKENCAKVYSIGVVTYFSTEGIGLLTRISAPIIVTSLISCLLIFMLIIPIALAPELLPSDFRRKIRMKRHMNAVKKIKQSANQG